MLAATNEPWAIEDSFLRPGRLGKCIFMGPLESEGRYEFFLNSFLQQYKNEYHNQTTINIDLEKNNDQLISEITNYISIEELVKETNGYTGADLSALVLRANYILTYNNNNKSIGDDRFTLKNIIPSCLIFGEVIKEMKPSNTKEEIDKYIRWYNYKFT